MAGPITGRKVRVAVLGAGAWANRAHLPGWVRDGRAEVVAICDTNLKLAEEAAPKYGAAEVSSNYKEIVSRPDIDVIDVCTPSHTHFELAWAALEAGKHVLCEKPVAYDFRDTRRAAELARSKGLKTKLGFTFRYSPAMRYMRELVAQGFIGTPFIFNGYEQNSQWLDPKTPLRQVDPDADQSVLQVSSLEGYGAPIIDLGAPARSARSQPGRRHDAQLHPRADGARDRPHDAHEHRRRRHLPRRVRERRALLGPDQLRHRRQLSRHRGAHLRQQGRAHLPPGRGGRRLRDAQGRHAGPRRVPRAGDPGALLSARAAARASRGARCSTPT